MNVSDIMSSDVVTVQETATLAEAIGLMLRHRISGIPVLNDQHALIGILTEGDLLRRTETGTAGTRAGWWARLSTAPGRLAQDFVHTHSLRVRDVMTLGVVSIGPDALLEEVVRAMQLRGLRRLPVVRDGQLVGIVSRADVVRVLYQLLPSAPEGAAGAHSDDQIRGILLHKMHQETWVPRSLVEIAVKDGVVVFSGLVTDLRERTGLRVLAETTPGVRTVRDETRWIEPTTGMLLDTLDEDRRPA